MEWPSDPLYFVVFHNGVIVGCIDSRGYYSPKFHKYAVFHDLSATEQDNVCLDTQDFITLRNIVKRLTS